MLIARWSPLLDYCVPEECPDGSEFLNLSPRRLRLHKDRRSTMVRCISADERLLHSEAPFDNDQFIEESPLDLKNIRTHEFSLLQMRWQTQSHVSTTRRQQIEPALAR